MRANAIPSRTAIAMPATTTGLVQPALGPWLMARSSASAAVPSVTAPAMSNGASVAVRSVSGSTADASTTVASGTGATKIHRHPNASTAGPRATTPTTGAPAPTIDHQPSACARRSEGNIRLMMASDDGPSAAPMAAPSARHAMRTPTLGDSAVNAAKTDTPARLHRYTVRWPRRSPSLPAAGPNTANISSGAVTTHVTVDSVECSSVAMRGIDVARIVMVNPTENSPNRQVASTRYG